MSIIRVFLRYFSDIHRVFEIPGFGYWKTPVPGSGITGYKSGFRVLPRTNRVLPGTNRVRFGSGFSAKMHTLSVSYG